MNEAGVNAQVKRELEERQKWRRARRGVWGTLVRVGLPWTGALLLGALFFGGAYGFGGVAMGVILALLVMVIFLNFGEDYRSLRQGAVRAAIEWGIGFGVPAALYLSGQATAWDGGVRPLLLMAARLFNSTFN